MTKNYIGSKVIKAEPMDECTFLETVKGEHVENRETRAGYLVIYPPPSPGGRNYESWSPAEVFETAYRELTDAEYDFLTQGDD